MRWQSLLEEKRIDIPEGLSLSVKKWFIKGDGVMKYMEYVELKEARDSSKKAQWTAITAIIVAVVLGVIQLHTQLSENISFYLRQI